MHSTLSRRDEKNTKFRVISTERDQNDSTFHRGKRNFLVNLAKMQNLELRYIFIIVQIVTVVSVLALSIDINVDHRVKIGLNLMYRFVTQGSDIGRH